MLDLIVRNGLVVDGAGAPAKRSDVGVRGGRIVAIGPVDEPAARTIDADGLVVAPGFIDPHTHYDAQIMWDPALTPSSFHGVTTVLGGNCGFTIAPIEPRHAEYVVPMLARVEGMSVEALQAGLDLRWDSFGSWLDRLDGRVAVNAGFMCGHSTVRRHVMGEAAVGEEATPAQIEEMVRLLHRSLDAGALGLTSSRAATHLDQNGDPVPSRFATRDELLTLCRALQSHDGTWLGIVPTIDRIYNDDTVDLLADMAVAAERPLNWNILLVRPGDAEAESRRSKLRSSDVAAARGAQVVGLALPIAMGARLSFDTGIVLETLPGFEILREPTEVKLRELRDPAVRRRLVEGAASIGYRGFSDWPNMRVSDVGDPSLKPLIGRSFADIGAERGIDAFDALLDVVIEDELRTGLEPPVLGDDDDTWAERVRVLRDTRTLPGGSDAGAHLDFNKTFGATSEFIARAVRRQRLLEIEEAVRMLTGDIAQYFGLVDRGRVAEGYHADLVVFDPGTIDAAPIEMVGDMPAGAMRLTGGATGIYHVVVNGTEIVDHGRLTGELPGTVLRSGRDTRTSA